VSIYDSVADKLDYLEVPLCTAIAGLMNSPDLGVKHRWNTRLDRQGQDYYGVLRNATTVAGCPDAMLIEHCYHTNETTVRWLLSLDNLDALAELEAETINRLWRKQHGLEDDNVIKFREKSENVRLWQRGLIDAGFDLGTWGADGSFGPATLAATNAFKDAVGLPKDDPATVTLVEWYALQAYQKGNADDGITQADVDREIAKTNEALAIVRVLQDQIEGLKITVNSKVDDLAKLKKMEQDKAEILSRA
jgi:hypothetical protein